MLPPDGQSRPRAAQSPAGALREIERLAAATPSDTRLWNAALAELRQGRATDADVGAGAATIGMAPVAVAVVTPYFREDLATLRRCHESVLAQTHPCRHIMVADGFPRPEIGTWDVEHIRLPAANADYGDTPRVAGGERALAQGCGAIAYLDADNSYRPRHVESMVGRSRSAQADVVFCGRTQHFPDGRMLPRVDPQDCRGHIDTNCLLLAGRALAMTSAWLAYPRQLAMIDDRFVVRMLRARGLRFACTGALTVRYTVNYASVYRELGLAVPPGARADFDATPIAAHYRSLSAAQWQDIDARLGFPAAAFVRNFVMNWGIDLRQPD